MGRMTLRARFSQPDDMETMAAVRRALATAEREFRAAMAERDQCAVHKRCRFVPNRDTAKAARREAYLQDEVVRLQRRQFILLARLCELAGTGPAPSYAH